MNEGFLAYLLTSKGFTPWKIKMEHKKEALEADFSFQLGDFGVPYQTLGGWCFADSTITMKKHHLGNMFFSNHLKQI